MKLIDYIYADDARINSYAQQISLRSLLRRFPNWLTEVSLSVIKINLNRSSKLDEQSRYEKIAKIVRYMKDTGELLERRPNWQGKDLPDFWLENCTAIRAFFELKNQPEMAFAIWVSCENECEVQPLLHKSIGRAIPGRDYGKLGKLFLLENLEPKDLDFQKRISSPYSVLHALGLILDSKLDTEIDQQQYQALDNELAQNPIEALKSMGAKVGAKRKISVLYKIRNLFPEFYESKYQLTVIGYPVFVADNSTGKNLKVENILGT